MGDYIAYYSKKAKEMAQLEENSKGMEDKINELHT